MTNKPITPPVDHLILLAGENPLPNAVAALYFQPKRITIVPSSGTVHVADYLGTWIWQRKAGLFPAMTQEPVISERVDEADGDSIFDTVSRLLASPTGESIGLNYTGGTKAMAVHAFRAVERWAQRATQKHVVSYLDARTLSLCFNSLRPGQPAPSPISLVDHVRIELRDLLALHQLEFFASQVNEVPRLVEVAVDLAQAYRETDAVSSWRDWKKSVLNARCRQTNSDRSMWREPRELEALSLPLPDGTSAAPFTRALAKIATASGNEISVGEVARAHFRFGRTNTPIPSQLCQWLDGTWLEHLTLAAVQRLSGANPAFKLHGIGQGMTTINPDEPGRAFRNKDKEFFEIDVTAIQGYQLYAFSCGTALALDELKLKMFEAHVRARQIGGSEARVAMVCLLDRVRLSDLKRELRMLGDPHVEFFGIDDLGSIDAFAFEIAKWMSTQMRASARRAQG